MNNLIRIYVEEKRQNIVFEGINYDDNEFRAQQKYFDLMHERIVSKRECDER